MKKVWGLLFSILIPIAGYTQASKNDLIGLGMAPELANELVKGTVSNSSYIIQVDGDPQRKFTFDASSDTALTMKFGDGTAAQTFTILGSTADNADTQVLGLTAGSSLSAGASAFAEFYGNEHASTPGRVNIWSGTDGSATGDIILAPIDDLIIRTSQDANRLITFDSSSDTALAMKFGDGGTTAAQEFTISGSTSNTDDDSVLNLTGGGSLTTGSGAYIQLFGNQSTGFGAMNLLTGGDNGSEDITMGATDDIILKLSNDSNRLITFDSSSDTALQMTFGDSSTTASQVFSIAGGGGSDDDDTKLNLLGGSSASTTEGGIIEITGNDFGGTNAGGSVKIYSGDTTAGDIVLSIENASTDVIIQDTTSGALWTFANSGTLIGAGTATIGWTVVAGAGACSTTCVTPCVFGVDNASATADIVSCSDVNADECLCAGAS